MTAPLGRDPPWVRVGASRADDPSRGSGALAPDPREGCAGWAPRPRILERGPSAPVSPTHPWVGSLPSGAVTLQCFLYCLYSLNHHQNPLANTLLGKMFTWGALDTIAPPRFLRCSQSAAPGAVPDEGETVPNSPNAASCARPNSIAASDKRVSRNSILMPTFALRRSIWISATKAFCYCRRPGRGGAED